MKVPIRIPVEKSGTGNYNDTPDIEITILAWLMEQDTVVRVGGLIAHIAEDKVEIDLPSPASGKLEIVTPVDSQFTLTSEVIEVCEDGTAFYKKVLGYIETAKDETPIPAAPVATEDGSGNSSRLKITPVAARMMEANGISPEMIAGRNEQGRIDKAQVEAYLNEGMERASRDARPVLVNEASVSALVATPALAEREISATEVRATPAARALARERGIDLATVHGNGPGGIIVSDDIPPETRNPAITEPPPVIPTPNAQQANISNFEGDEQPIVLSPIQQTIARNLEEGWRIPTAMDAKDYQLSILLSFRALYAKKFEQKIGARLQLAFPLVAAIVRVLAQDEFRRRLNGYVRFNDSKKKYEFVPSKDVNLGVAFNTPKDDLVILTVHGAQTLSLRNLAHATATLQQKSQDSTFTLADTGGFSFIFNNVGGLITLVDKAYRDKVRNIHGYSLLTPKVAVQLDLGNLGSDGWTDISITFDHRAMNGGHTTKFMNAVLIELYERVIPELQALCDES